MAHLLPRPPRRGPPLPRPQCPPRPPLRCPPPPLRPPPPRPPPLRELLRSPFSASWDRSLLPKIKMMTYNFYIFFQILFLYCKNGSQAHAWRELAVKPHVAAGRWWWWRGGGVKPPLIGQLGALTSQPPGQ